MATISSGTQARCPKCGNVVSVPEGPFTPVLWGKVLPHNSTLNCPNCGTLFTPQEVPSPVAAWELATIAFVAIGGTLALVWLLGIV